jgi:ankyrin repeat protein
VDTKLGKKNTPLVVQASKEGSLGVVQILLNRNANIDAQDSDGNTALMKAAKEGFLPIVQLLISKKADINKSLSNSKKKFKAIH